MDGLELLRKLRQTSQMPVVFLTSRMMKSMRFSDSKWELMITSRSRFQRLLIERIRAVCAAPKRVMSGSDGREKQNGDDDGNVMVLRMTLDSERVLFLARGRRLADGHRVYVLDALARRPVW